jgi:hypothetical protein
MITRIPDDPFAGIQVPSFSMESMPVKSEAAEPVAVQVSRSDSVSTDSVTAEVPTPTPEGTAIDVVGNDGKLNKVPRHSTWTTPTAYPTYLRTTTSGKNVTLDSNGLELDNGAGQTVRLFFTAFTRNMTIREVDVCVGGVSKKMLILASDAY